ncbi:MAG: hypothetical protein R8G66_03530 [Cytophagales bacterium]|nr:hypothetical protein [Cytophagales bacterium]
MKPLNASVEANYENHTLSVSYRKKGESNDLVSIPEQVTITLPEAGTFNFLIDEPEDILGLVRIAVRGPSSEIYRRDYEYQELKTIVDTGSSTISPDPKTSTTKTKGGGENSVPLEILVDPQQVIVIVSDDQVAPYKISGRLINFENGEPIAQTSIFVHLHLKSTDENLPILDIPVHEMVKSDSAGYFSFDAPGGMLWKGFLMIAGVDGKQFLLQPDTGNADQLDPNQVIVLDGDDVISINEHDEDDCGCHGDPDDAQMPDAEDLVLSGAYKSHRGKGCVDFTQPNRALEEFSYVKIVRTTEPEFKKVPYRKPPLLRLPGGSNFSNVIDAGDIQVDQMPDETGQSAKMVKGSEGQESAPDNNDGNTSDSASSGATQKATAPDLRPFYLYIQNSWAANRACWIFTDRPYELIDTSELMFTPVPDSYPLYNPVELWMTKLEELFLFIYEKAHKTEPELKNFLKWINERFMSEHQRRPANPEEMEDFVTRFFEEGSQGRVGVDSAHPIDWDDTPTFYHNTSIAHGHIVHFKQIWRADGYSMGDLLYSLPLAPCQKKQIAIFDWGRSESTGRTESLTAEDRLSSHLSRDRDVTDIINTSLSEQIKGGSESELYSKSKTSGIGGGIGGSFGSSASASLPAGATGLPVDASGSMSLGVSGGLSGGFGKQVNESNSSSSAWQDSARDLSANSMNSLKDSIMQSASSVRSQRSTVVETLDQNETLNVQTEVIANHNHCHSMTVQYFEVLRHLAVEQKVVAAQECLFIPLEMSPFTSEKILRWKDELFRVLPAAGLRDGIVALEDIKRKYQYAGPDEILADELIQEVYGEITLSVNINRPEDEMVEVVVPVAAVGASGGTITKKVPVFKAENWDELLPFLGEWNLSKVLSAFEDKSSQERDLIWSAQILPEVIVNMLDQIEVDAYDSSEQPLNLDLEMQVEPNVRTKFNRIRGRRGLKKSLKIRRMKGYRPGNEMKLILRMYPGDNTISRRQIRDIRISNTMDLPTGSKIVFFGGFLNYQSERLNEQLFSTLKRHQELPEEGIDIPTPLNKQERFSPIKEAYRTANRLIEHINDHLEYYHQRVWRALDSNKRYMMLDGFTAPNADGRSVASVVENRLVDIVGNNLVMPVAPGVRIDPSFKLVKEGESQSSSVSVTLTKQIDLLKHYTPDSPMPPFRISVPTRGVYAEAVMGNCNSCEKIDESRHWRFTEVPCGNEPTVIQPISTDSRRAAPSDLTAKDFATPIVNIQNAPDAPNPQGFAGAIDALTASDAFNNITGLDQNQKNALEALKAASSGSSGAFDKSIDAAKEFAKMAKEIAMHASSIKNSAKTADAIDKAVDDGKISKKEGDELHVENIKSRIPSLMKDSQDLPKRDPESIKGMIPDHPEQFESFEASDDLGKITFTSGRGYGLSDSQDTEINLDVDDWTLMKEFISGDPDLKATYKKLLTHRPGTNMTASLEARFGADAIPKIKEDTYSDTVNIDLYWMDILEMPTGLDENNIFESFRKGFNVILEKEVFTPLDNNIDGPVWNSANAEGAVVSILLKDSWIGSLEDGSVVLSELGTDYWIFTTIYTPGQFSAGPFNPGEYTNNDGYHPVTGNRMFGVRKKNIGGKDIWTVFILAIDGRTSTWFYRNVAPDPFPKGHEFWQSYFSDLSDKIEENNGKTGQLYVRRAEPKKNELDNFLGENVF